MVREAQRRCRCCRGWGGWHGKCKLIHQALSDYCGRLTLRFPVVAKRYSVRPVSNQFLQGCSRMPVFPLIRSSRGATAMLLALLYAVIALSPLAPIALKSARIAHVVTGECSGDCEIDGCSLESRIGHSCCCARSKQTQTEQIAQVAPACCSPKVAQTVPEPEAGCCEATPKVASAKQSGCCVVGASDHPVQTASGADREGRDRQTVYKCGSPCGNGAPLAFSGIVKMELIPAAFTGIDRRISLEQTRQLSPGHLTSRYGDPPDPPPKLS